MRNALFWAHHIRDIFLPELVLLEETVVSRVLPAFDNIEAEAESVEEEVC